ncbi:zinc-binding dehydrogenase [Streptomyces sp. GESEQ-4]|uniref:zinc-binding dehydrogenase n=1 Tax=Streptomyces sp. GESEQ-4 TaxID=2812655 RepID=UPI0027DAEE96|nr:zinc-binding dehydrogenase [Streptomyces sp. GESEQ-4]
MPDPGPGEALVKIEACGVMAGIDAAINTGNVGRGDTVAVIGCGGVGDAAVGGANLAGAVKIIAVDMNDRKLATARKLGATHTVNSKEADPTEAIRELTGGFGADARDLAGTVLVGVPTPEMKLELPLLDAFVTETIALDEVEKAFGLMHGGDVLRSVVVF